MHSKWQIWDFFSSFQRDFLASFNGVLGITAFDPVCFKLLKDFLQRGSEGRVVHHKIASEVTKAWIEEEFQTLSLFGSADCFFIHQAQDIKAEMLEVLGSLGLNDRFIVLCYETEGAGWKKIVKYDSVSSLAIESPRFWENNKLLDFISSYIRLPISYEAKNWIMESLENDLSTFYNVCIVLKLNFPDTKEVSLVEVKSLFTLDKLDQFALAALFNRKRFIDFYEKLVLLEGDFEKMRSLFLFMQSHLVKLADTSYLAQKPRLNQYDKDLQNSAKLWKSEDIIREIQRFNDWEIRSKKKDQFLWADLRQVYLRVLNNTL